MSRRVLRPLVFRKRLKSPSRGVEPGFMERSYRNLCYVLPILLPIFLAGFWIPYLSEIPHFDVSITTAVHVHAILLFSFLILLIVQPLAIRYGAFSIHRILGKLSNVLMPLSSSFLSRCCGRNITSI